MTKIESTFENVINASIPANVSAVLQANVDRARGNYERAVSQLRSYVEVSNMILNRQQAITRQWNARVIENATENVSAAFDVAEKLAKSRTATDATNIHAEFLQTQTQRLIGQVHDAVSFTSKAGTEAFETWSSMVAAGFGKAS